MAALGADLRREDLRLLTLTGPGGVGKTRLALAVAAAATDLFVDHIWFVDLAPIGSPDLVMPAIARHLGIREVGSGSLQARIESLLGQRHLLLVIDNFEHVAEAGPAVTALLAACPRMKALVTSRQRLRLSGEHERAVLPLGLPPPATRVADSSVAALARSEAVRLFVDRAKGAQDDFVLTPENASMVAEVCRRLDGLPLAIELVAARVKVLPPAALLARLDRRLPLLTGGPRDLPARLQTMQAAIAWSYDHLTAAEQALFRRLAVFASGFTLEAAEAVCASEEAPSVDQRLHSGLAVHTEALNLIASLVDKSLLQVDASATGETRYGMLEMIREFGLEQLSESGEAATYRTRHALWCRRLVAHTMSFPLRGTVRPDALDRLDAEVGSLRAGLDWYAEQGEVAELVDLAIALTHFWALRGYRIEGLRWLERALAMADRVEISPPLHAAAFHAAAALSRTNQDRERALHLAEEALARFRALGDARITASSVHLLGLLERGRGNLQRAALLHREALALFNELEEPFWAALVTSDLGFLAHWEGDDQRAVALLKESLVRFRTLDDPWGRGVALSGLALVTGDRGDFAAAAGMYRESLERLLPVGSKEPIVDVVARIATLAAATANAVTAARLLGAVEALGQALGYTFEQPEQLRNERATSTTRAVLGDDAFDAVWASGQALSFEEAVAAALAFLADPAVAEAAPFALTPREAEILRLLAAGDDDRAIADRLFISPATVARHVANLYGKLGVDSRAKAVASAHRHGLA